MLLSIIIITVEALVNDHLGKFEEVVLTRAGYLQE